MARPTPHLPHDNRTQMIPRTSKIRHTIRKGRCRERNIRKKVAVGAALAELSPVVQASAFKIVVGVDGTAVSTECCTTRTRRSSSPSRPRGNGVSVPIRYPKASEKWAPPNSTCCPSQEEGKSNRLLDLWFSDIVDTCLQTRRRSHSGICLNGRRRARRF